MHGVERVGVCNPYGARPLKIFCVLFDGIGVVEQICAQFLLSHRTRHVVARRSGAKPEPKRLPQTNVPRTRGKPWSQIIGL